ncbi:MAG: nucleotidyltransferase family protein [Planctomycetota bacterium]
MDAILLAGGYGTRLYPLTKDRPKALLPVGGEPIVNHVVAWLEACDEIERMFMVSNDKFSDDLAGWAEQYSGDKPITVLNDGTLSNDDRLGAIGDIKFVLDNADVRSEAGVYVLGTDNLAGFDITSIVDLSRERDATAVFASRIEDRQRLCRMGVVRLAEDGRVLEFVEKPDDPPSQFAVPPFYAYSPEAVSLLPQYLEEGNDPDAPGHFIAWLADRSAVYANVIDQEVLDIGTPRAYEAAKKQFGDE